MNDITIKDYDAQAIKDILRTAKVEIEALRKVIESKQAIVDECREELDRRALAAYWEAHPNETSLNAGDKVMVTDEYNRYYNTDVATHGQLPSLYTAGTVVHIGGIGLNKRKPVYMWTNEFGGQTPITIAQGMRRAYLAQQETNP